MFLWEMIGRTVSTVVNSLTDLVLGWRKASFDQVVKNHVSGSTNGMLDGAVNELLTETNYLQRRMRKALSDGDYATLEAMRKNFPKIVPNPSELQGAYERHMEAGRGEFAQKLMDLYGDMEKSDRPYESADC